MSLQDLLKRGWRHWSNEPDDEGQVLMLCPLQDFANVPDGTIMESVCGKKYIKGKDHIDDDTRSGLLAFGVRRSIENG